MKNGIPADRYYFLLEWKDANMEDYLSMYGERRMCDLTTYELNKLHEAIKANEDKTRNERGFCQMKAYKNGKCTLYVNRKCDKCSIWQNG